MARKKHKNIRSVHSSKKQPKHAEHIENLKKVLHNLYFSKREEEIIEKERENTLGIREMNKELASFEKNIEKKVEQLEKEVWRIENLEKVLSVINGVVTELRKDNEELRKERKFFVEKLNNFIAGQRVGAETQEEPVPEGEEEKRRAFADHHGESKIKTSFDQLLELVMEKGSIKVPDAAKKLRVKDKQIEEWARILEEHDLIEVHYPTFGKPFLKKKN